MTPSGHPSGPTQEHAYCRGPRITAVETAIPSDVMPGLLLLRIHTDAGTVDGEDVVGHGETYYIPEAASTVLHDWMAQRLLGADASAIESSLAVLIRTHDGIWRDRRRTPSTVSCGPGTVGYFGAIDEAAGVAATGRSGSRRGARVQ